MAFSELRDFPLPLCNRELLRRHPYLSRLSRGHFHHQIAQISLVFQTGYHGADQIGQPRDSRILKFHLGCRNVLANASLAPALGRMKTSIRGSQRHSDSQGSGSSTMFLQLHHQLRRPLLRSRGHEVYGLHKARQLQHPQ